MFSACRLSPLECKLHKGQDVHLINSFMYLGNEETVNKYLLNKAINA